MRSTPRPTLRSRLRTRALSAWWSRSIRWTTRYRRPRFPEKMREAYDWMAMVEGAVDLLADRGMVDANKVGLGGFSRTSWLTDFTLTHSSYNFAAASSADSGIYTYGQYFKDNSRVLMTGLDNPEVGGPHLRGHFPCSKYWLEYWTPLQRGKGTHTRFDGVSR